MNEIDYYKINEVLNHKYYQIPQELFENSLYKETLDLSAKFLYGFILDRISLSAKHHWYDENGNIYLIFTRDEARNKLNLSPKTITKAFKQLIETDLIHEKRQGFGKPNLIFVGKIKHEDKNNSTDTQNLPFKNSKTYTSGVVENTSLDTEILPPINTNNINTDITNTNSINPNSEECSLNNIKEKCKLNEFEKDEISILENVIENLYYSNNLKVGACIITNSKILSKLELITKENLLQLLDILKNTNGIKNVTNYLMICLYNNLGNAHLQEKYKSTAWASKRILLDESLDKLYANYSIDNALTSP